MDYQKTISDGKQDAVIIGQDGGLAEVFRLIEVAAWTDLPVLITGETGTGKSLVAKAIHERSAAKRRPFIRLNCLSLPEKPADAEILVHEISARFRTTPRKQDFFETEDGASLFLDEIGGLPPCLQARLTGLIDEEKASLFDSLSGCRVPMRIISSSNVDVEQAVGTTFRKDLYYRLNAIRIRIPPLRERRQDIPALCRHLLNGMQGGTETTLPFSELNRLMEYDWPGNVWELKNVIESAFMLGNGREFRPSDFLQTRRERQAKLQNVQLTGPDGEDHLMTLEDLEKKHIKRALNLFSGNITHTAKALDMSRSTLKRRIKGMSLSAT